MKQILHTNFRKVLRTYKKNDHKKKNERYVLVSQTQIEENRRKLQAKYDVKCTQVETTIKCKVGIKMI